MCGIFGYVLRRRDGAAVPPLDVAVRALRHRGPDDQGTFQSDAGDLACGLAHTRLSIVDLSAAGHQPMFLDGGALAIVYNGEIYNFRDVRRELESSGVTFQSQCDTEVLLRAYQRWGKECLTKLRGMFAFGIWDAKRRSLFLARDRLGVKPLYYAETRDGIVFSSEVRALLATRAVERKVSVQGLATYLQFGAVQGPYTIVRDVRSLSSGSFLEHGEGSTRIEPYWEIPLRTRSSLSREEATRSLREILRDSVRMRLIADVPVGVFLSGGIDSSVVAGLASNVAATKVHTFTVTFDEKAYDEATHAAGIARLFGCEHHEAHLSGTEAVADMDAALASLDQPSVDGINTYFVSRAARRAGFVVALSGIGGDELFAGYSSFRRFKRAVEYKKLLPLPGAARRALGRLARGDRFSTAVRKAAALAEGPDNAAAMYSVLRSMFLPRERDALLEPDFAPATAPGGGERLAMRVQNALDSGEIDSVNAYGALELVNYTQQMLLRDTDAMSMAHSLEVREPLLDHVLVEYAMQIPGALKLEGVGNKPMLTAAAPEIPRTARTRAKMGFELPFEPWLRGPLGPWAREQLVGGAGRATGVIRREASAQLWRAFEDRSPRVSWSRVWCVAVLTDWCRRYEMSA